MKKLILFAVVAMVSLQGYSQSFGFNKLDSTGLYKSKLDSIMANSDTSGSSINLYKNFAYMKAKIRVKECEQCVIYWINCYQYFDGYGKISYYREIDNSKKIPKFTDQIIFGKNLILVAFYQKKW